mmetsp:Transcript_67510/g.170332  ORF Transcript_67510/g.170332 Transcript_67510/m.170332 type:complete len:273 (-) Transcript_67510:394-1212(-)
MAATLKFLSRTPCKQHLLAASPKLLGSVTPKTAAKSPLASGSAFFGNFEHTPLQGSEETAAPNFGILPVASAFRRSAEASAAAQKDLAASVRPSAESARQHFLAKQTQRSGEATFAESQGGLLGSRLPTLLQQSHETAPSPPRAEGSSGSTKPGSTPAAWAYAERARKHFVERQQAQLKSGKIPEFSGMATLLTHGQAAPCADLPVLLGHATRTQNEVAETPVLAKELVVGPQEAKATTTHGDARTLAETVRQSFMERQRNISSRTTALQVP